MKFKFPGQSKCSSKQPCPSYIFDADGEGVARQPDSFPWKICKCTLVFSFLL